MVTHSRREDMGMCRLANQMFQMAAVIGYAKKWNMDYYFPTSIYSKYFPKIKFSDRKNTFPIHEEKTFAYYDIPYMENVCLKGYWQSYKTLEPIIDELRDLFGVNEYIINNPCSIHIRRGDYVQYADRFPPITMEYIERAMTVILDKTGCNNFIVFSDDIEWCQKHITYERFNRCNILFRIGDSDIDDLIHMVNCEHNIICNSSYSLLAALLNPNPNKFVVAPHYTQWFGKEVGLDTSTLFPPSFHQIKI